MTQAYIEGDIEGDPEAKRKLIWRLTLFSVIPVFIGPKIGPEERSFFHILKQKGMNVTR